MSEFSSTATGKCREVYVTSLLSLKTEEQLEEIRQMLIDMIDIVGQTPNEEPVTEAFLAFEACARHHGS